MTTIRQQTILKSALARNAERNLERKPNWIIVVGLLLVAAFLVGVFYQQIIQVIA